MNTSNPVTKILSLIVGVILTAGLGVWGYTQFAHSNTTAATDIGNAVGTAGNAQDYAVSASGGGLASGNLTPFIQSVQFVGSSTNPTILINGQGFGAAPSGVPGTVDNGSAAIDSATWAMGNPNDAVTSTISYWSNTQIAVQPSGDYGINGWVFQSGDSVSIAVQAGGQVLSFHATVAYVSSAPSDLAGFSYGVAYPDGETADGVWNVTNSNTAPNGVPLLFSTIVNDPTTKLTVSFQADDVAEAYVDGKPRWIATWTSGAPQTFSLFITPGNHVVQFFAENTAGQNPISNQPSNPAVFAAQITDGNGTMLASTAKISPWTVQQASVGYDPYMEGSTSQNGPGAFVSGDAQYGATSGLIPIGPANLPQ